MNILVVGSGGREHAIIRALKQSPKAEVIYALPGNGGIAADAICVEGKATDIDRVVAFSKENAIDFVVVAPDNPLVLGMLDALNAEGIATFGPRGNAAVIEGSKVFSKNLMKKYGIPTARYETFDDAPAAIRYIHATGEYPVVIKADGLALGKGVIIAQNADEADEAVRSIMEDKAFGASGNSIVVEQFLEGVEVSVLAFTDGRTVKPMISSMDHKRANDHDEGLNTGGMGTIAPNPHYTPAIAEECMEKIFLPTIRAMEQEGRPFTGCLYFGLMLTREGPYVIEYNCRFGDPETQVVLPLLESDLLEIMLATYHGTLDQTEIRWSNQSAACVILASGGYPVSYQTGYPIRGLDAGGQCERAVVYHAGTKLEDGRYLTAGGRVLGITCTGEDLQKALDAAYSAVKKISFTDMHFRTDIGQKALEPLN